ncbi:MGT2 magnesium transporter [Trypanosoma grayi]|uniref:MGT2 magnesium transporter n=1 Tax=Trypanosoma grayi TaxID=71804 RepID=UPI0004F441B1|nr:MGT2 magnesium transporter [Trypanosoma grayi]KEG08217.1 MGT2 magnesium transporter [Trypanosoma grayi]
MLAGRACGRETARAGGEAVSGAACADAAEPRMRRCVVVHQSPESAVSTQRFRSPDEAATFVRKMAGGHSRGCMWVDLQGHTVEQRRKILQLLFPDMQPGQLEVVLDPETYDAVELQPVKGEYIVGCLACARDMRGCVLDADGEGDAVFCSFVCNERFLVTMHVAPFVGLAELQYHVEAEFSRTGPEPSTTHRESGSTDSVAVMGAAVLCALVCFTCEAYLPDPTALISEIDCIDEMVMLVEPGRRDQTDLLRRVSVLRRRIAASNRQLYIKEKLLHELVGPTMRTTFVSRDPCVVCAYRETHGKLSQVLDRLEIARDTLNHANLNFMNAVSMRMSQSSARLDWMMTFLSQIATVCLPANLLASMFGMNCRVPWQADEYDNLNAFWGIVGLILVWMAVCFVVPIHTYFFQREEA